MNDISAILKAWEELERRPFPAGHRGKVVQGHDLTTLESEAGAFILTLTHGEPLGARQRNVIVEINDRLTSIIAELEGDGKSYFKQLQRVLRLAIDTISPSQESQEG